MNNEESEWLKGNQDYLSHLFDKVRNCIKGDEKSKHKLSRLKLDSNYAIGKLSEDFSLTLFEACILLLCAGIELESDFGELCATAHGNIECIYSTFGLAVNVFENVHFSAFSPKGRLRQWKLLSVEEGPSLLQSPLRISERVLYYLIGVNYFDTALSALVQPLQNKPVDVESHNSIAKEISRLWGNNLFYENSFTVVLSGVDILSIRNVALLTADTLKSKIYTINIQMVPRDAEGLDNFRRLLQRETLMSNCIYLLDVDTTEGDISLYKHVVCYLIRKLKMTCILISNQLISLIDFHAIKFEVHKPLRDEQIKIWNDALGKLKCFKHEMLEKLVEQFSLNTVQIKNIAAELRLNDLTDCSSEALHSLIWNLCRHHVQRPLDGLIQVIDAKAKWSDLVLPDDVKNSLGQILSHMKQRHKVYREWGFSDKLSKGLGVPVLLSGVSGTGKTMAAEVIAKELQLDLYRVDLGAVVSKYIGETEKNLEKVFSAAESSGAILLFDEADALFSKRSDVKDSHDRYANMEVSYLLQRIEAYEGLTILTTNLKTNIDDAFTRRFSFIIHFPFPDKEHRKKIWEGVFPNNTPIQTLDIDKLSELNITGGNIINIAINAAFIAAESEEPVSMNHVYHASQNEYSKLERPLVEVTFGD